MLDVGCWMSDVGFPQLCCQISNNQDSTYKLPQLSVLLLSVSYLTQPLFYLSYFFKLLSLCFSYLIFVCFFIFSLASSESHRPNLTMLKKGSKTKETNKVGKVYPGQRLPSPRLQNQVKGSQTSLIRLQDGILEGDSAEVNALANRRDSIRKHETFKHAQ